MIILLFCHTKVSRKFTEWPDKRGCDLCFFVLEGGEFIVSSLRTQGHLVIRVNISRLCASSLPNERLRKTHFCESITSIGQKIEGEGWSRARVVNFPLKCEAILSADSLENKPPQPHLFCQSFNLPFLFVSNQACDMKSSSQLSTWKRSNFDWLEVHHFFLSWVKEKEYFVKFPRRNLISFLNEKSTL